MVALRFSRLTDCGLADGSLTDRLTGCCRRHRHPDGFDGFLAFGSHMCARGQHKGLRVRMSASGRKCVTPVRRAPNMSECGHLYTTNLSGNLSVICQDLSVKEVV